MTDYTPVSVADAFAEEDAAPDVHLDIMGEHVDLPNLNSPKLPLGIVSAALDMTQGGDVNAGLRTFLDYFKHSQPALWARLETAENGAGWLVAIIEAWANQSGLDPKA